MPIASENRLVLPDRLGTSNRSVTRLGHGCSYLPFRGGPGRLASPRLLRARSYRIVVRGSAWRAAIWTSRKSTPAAELVESNVPTTLNTSTGAGTLGLFPGLVITVAG